MTRGKSSNSQKGSKLMFLLKFDILELVCYLDVHPVFCMMASQCIPLQSTGVYDCKWSLSFLSVFSLCGLDIHSRTCICNPGLCVQGLGMYTWLFISYLYKTCHSFCICDIKIWQAICFLETPTRKLINMFFQLGINLIKMSKSSGNYV